MSNRPRVNYVHYRKKGPFGTRSLIFIFLLFSWTLLCAVPAFYFLIAALPTEFERELAKQHIPEGEAALTAWFTLGICCPGVVWVIIAFPLLIAAIVTMRSR